MKVLPSNAKSLQPIPKDSGIHSNIFSNTNGANQGPLTNGNISVAQNDISPFAQTESAKNGNTFPFFALSCLIILIIALVIIFKYRKIKRK